MKQSTKKADRVEFYFHSDSLGCIDGLLDELKKLGNEARYDGEDHYGQYYATLFTAPIADKDFDDWYDAMLDVVFDNGCDFGCSLARMEETRRSIERRLGKPYEWSPRDERYHRR